MLPRDTSHYIGLRRPGVSISAATHMEVSITAVTPADLNFVWSSWTQSYRSSPHTRKFSDAKYQELMQPRIEAILQRSDVLVARPMDWPEGIIGWVCAEPETSTLHYCYCKTLWRRQGITTQLLTKMFGARIKNITFTSFTMPYIKYAPDTWAHKKVYPT